MQHWDDVYRERDSIDNFFQIRIGRTVSEIELESLWNGDCSDGALLVIYREIQEGVATQRFDKFWSACQNLKDDDRLPFDLPITTGRIDKGEPCNSPNFNGCLCIKETWSDEEEEDQTSEEDDN